MVLSIGCSSMRSRRMVEYSFTERGRDLMPIFYQIMLWGFKHEKDSPSKRARKKEWTRTHHTAAKPRRRKASSEAGIAIGTARRF